MSGQENIKQSEGIKIDNRTKKSCWSGCVARVLEKGYSYAVSMGKTDGKNPLKTLRRG